MGGWEWIGNKRRTLKGKIFWISSMFNFISPPDGSFYSSEVNIHWLNCIATQSWSIIILINALWSWIVQWVPHFRACWRKSFPILLFIFSFWIDSHPCTSLSDLYSFLGKESKCISFEITASFQSATKPYRVFPDKGSLANILLSSCFLGPKETKGFVGIFVTSYEPPNKPKSLPSFQKNILAYA